MSKLKSLFNWSLYVHWERRAYVSNIVLLTVPIIQQKADQLLSAPSLCSSVGQRQSRVFMKSGADRLCNFTFLLLLAVPGAFFLHPGLVYWDLTLPMFVQKRTNIDYDTPQAVGRVENGNQRVLKNLLAFFAAIWYIDQGQIVKKKLPKVLAARKLTSKPDPAIKK